MVEKIVIKSAELKDITRIYQIELENYGHDEATEWGTFQEIVEFVDSKYRR